MLINNFKIAIKVLMRRKLYTLISLTGISITLMVLVVSAAVLDTVYGQSLFETKRGRTVGLYTMFFYRKTGAPGTHIFPSYHFLTRRVRIKTLANAERAAIFTLQQPVVSYRDNQRFTIRMRRTDGDYWQVFDFDFLEGRPFTTAEFHDAAFLAVINRSIRDRYFDAKPAVGRTIEVDGQRFTVIGVVRNIPDYRVQQSGEVWVPITTLKSGDYLHPGMTGWFRAAVLAESRGHIPRLKEEFRARVAQIRPDRPIYSHVEAELETFFQASSRLDERPPDRYGRPHTRRWTAIAILIMFGFMLLPAVNLININVSRILERASEIGVRKAFGASSWNLVGQFVVENIVLTMIGGVGGLVLSAAMLHGLNRCGWIGYAQFHLNVQLLLYALGMIFFFGLLSGIYPAWKMSRLHPVEALRGATR